MKKITIGVVVLLLCFNYFIVSPDEIRVDDFLVRNNNLGNIQRIFILPEKSNTIIKSVSDESYFRQRLIDSRSGKDFDYQLDVYSFNEHTTIHYRILINSNENSETRMVAESRVDVIVESSFFWNKKSYSIDLSSEQVNIILKEISNIDFIKDQLY